jgi:hypothetical protein
MTTLFVRHKVADYESWRKGYDAFDARDAMGVTGHGVYCHLDDPNDVTVYHHFASPEAAKAFIGNPELQKAMQESGVVGEPQIWLTEGK